MRYRLFGRAGLYVSELCFRVRDAALISGSYDGMSATFGQLDEVLVTLGAKGRA